MGITDLYVKEFRRNIKYYYPNWKPSEKRELGDFGILERNIFSKIGNIRELGISFEILEHDVDGCESFGSNATITSTGKLTGGMSAVINAQIEINLKKESSVFLNSIFKKNYEIKSLYELEYQILKKLEQQEWNKKHVIITSIVESYNTIVAISEGIDSNVVLGCEAQNIVDLNKVELGFTLINKTDGVYSYFTRNDSSIIPMFRLAKLKGLFSQNMIPLRGLDDYNDDNIDYVDYQLEELE